MKLTQILDKLNEDCNRLICLEQKITEKDIEYSVNLYREFFKQQQKNSEYLILNIEIYINQIGIPFIQKIDKNLFFWQDFKKVDQFIQKEILIQLIRKLYSQLKQFGYSPDINQNIFQNYQRFKQYIDKKMIEEDVEYSAFDLKYLEISNKLCKIYEEYNKSFEVKYDNDNFLKNFVKIQKDLNELQQIIKNFEIKDQIKKNCLLNLFSEINNLIYEIQFGNTCEILKQIENQQKVEIQHNQLNDIKNCISQDIDKQIQQNYQQIHDQQDQIQLFDQFKQQIHQQNAEQKKPISVIEIEKNLFDKDNYKLDNFELIPNLKQNIQQDDLNQLQNFRYFIYDEELYFQESDQLEYKNYYLEPNGIFKDEFWEVIINNIIGMLNNKGGRIYVGIKEEQNRYVVKGNNITLKNQDELRCRLTQEMLYTRKIEPNVSSDLVTVKFIPVYNNIQEKKQIYHVIKIIVKPGDPQEIYCDKSFNCYFRRDGQLEKLKPDLFKIEFKKRINSQLNLEEYQSQLKKFSDPSPEKINHNRKLENNKKKDIQLKSAKNQYNIDNDQKKAKFLKKLNFQNCIIIEVADKHQYELIIDIYFQIKQQTQIQNDYNQEFKIFMIQCRTTKIQNQIIETYKNNIPDIIIYPLKSL